MINWVLSRNHKELSLEIEARGSLVSSPTPAFQCTTLALKSGRAWESKSRDIYAWESPGPLLEYKYHRSYLGSSPAPVPAFQCYTLKRSGNLGTRLDLTFENSFLVSSSSASRLSNGRSLEYVSALYVKTVNYPKSVRMTFGPSQEEEGLVKCLYRARDRRM